MIKYSGDVMRKVNISDARRQFGKILKRAERGERIFIYRHGKPAAAFVPIHDLKIIKQLASELRTKASNAPNA